MIHSLIVRSLVLSCLPIFSAAARPIDSVNSPAAAPEARETSDQHWLILLSMLNISMLSSPAWPGEFR